jgi:CBS domain-containing protein
MQVQEILQSKGDNVAWVAPDILVDEVLQLLAAHGVGALVVSSDGQTLIGIVSERDIVRGLARSGSALLTRPVAEIMTSPVHTCSPGDTIEELMARMTDGRFRHFPVLVDGRLVGVVSIGDIVKLRLRELEDEAKNLIDYIRGG